LLPLEIEDYQNIFKLLHGKPPLWSLDSLHRCVSGGLVSPDGAILTRRGRQKAEKLARGVDALQTGVPLSSRTADRSHLIGDVGPWFRGAFADTTVYWTSSCLIHEHQLDGSHAQRAEVPRNLRHEWNGYLNSKAWRKMEPYAVQIDVLGGMELICLRSLFCKSKFRIRSVYYDWFMQKWQTTTFWFRASQPTPEPIIAVKTRSGGIKNNISAIVKPVQLELTFPTL